jgi:signal transduction histidine kinase
VTNYMIQLNNQAYTEVFIPNAPDEVVLRDVAVRLIAAYEDERKRVAREIHDDLGQKIALLSLELGQIGQKIKEPELLRYHCQNLQNQIEEISTDVHRLAYKLHPAKLDHVGLLPAIKGLCTEITDSGKLNVEFRHRGSFARLSKEVTLCVFRIVQEALRNCMKHSGARVARAVLVNTGGVVRLSVMDEGRGFVMNRRTMESGLGFTSIRERLRIVGGTMSVNSSPSHGTRIEVSIPLDGDI